MKKRYREIFLKSMDAIQKRVEEIRPSNLEGDIFDKFDENSKGEQWQVAVLEMFEDDISHEIYRKWREIIAYRENFHCKGCATCCNLACSEFSPEELNLLRNLPFARGAALGPRILRAETAVAAALSCWQMISGDWSDK